jgi:hypothetical protein
MNDCLEFKKKIFFFSLLKEREKGREKGREEKRPRNKKCPSNNNV